MDCREEFFSQKRPSCQQTGEQGILLIASQVGGIGSANESSRGKDQRRAGSEACQNCFCRKLCEGKDGKPLHQSADGFRG